MSCRSLRNAGAAASRFLAFLAVAACASEDTVEDDGRFDGGAGAGGGAGIDASYDADEDVCMFNCDPPDAKPDANDSGPPPQDAKPDEPEPYSCDVVNNCTAASDMGSVSGDLEGDSVSRTGTTAQWLRVRVTEADTNVWANDQLVTITLISPPGANYDLFAYVNPDEDIRACTSPTAQSVKPAGATDTVTLTWGEEWTANNSDDSRTVSIEVKYISGACSPDDEWSLLVQGNK